MSNAMDVNDLDIDLWCYLHYNQDVFRMEDILKVHASVPGHNDEMSWYWVIESVDGVFILCCASCDYTGWDCASGGESWLADSLEGAVDLAPIMDDGRKIQKCLRDQIHGAPYGVEVISFRKENPGLPTN